VTRFAVTRHRCGPRSRDAAVRGPPPNPTRAAQPNTGHYMDADYIFFHLA